MKNLRLLQYNERQPALSPFYIMEELFLFPRLCQVPAMGPQHILIRLCKAPLKGKILPSKT